MELIRKATIPLLVNAGIESRQLLFPENSTSTRMTITQVTVPPGLINPTHQHDTSEQVWIALEGEGTLLLGDGKSDAFHAGDVVRFADGDRHGFHNTGAIPFTYISVTSPPINFRAAYARDWSAAIAIEQHGRPA
ncbi:MAG: cupin domain-containing protein [Betaproteobacteria bacterium]